MNEGARLVRNTAVIAIGNLSTKIVSFLLLPLYTALLTTEEYGTLDYYTSLAIFIIPFISFVMDEAVFRFLVDCKTDDEINKCFSEAFVIAGIGMIAFLLVMVPICILSSSRYLWFFIPYVILSIFTAFLNAFFRGSGRIQIYAVSNFLSSTLTILFNVLFVAVLRFGIVGMMLATILGQVCNVLYFGIRYRVCRTFAFGSLDWNNVKEKVFYALPLIPNRVSWNAVLYANRILIIFFLGSSANGIYAIACKFSMLINMVYGFFYQAWTESAARVQVNQSTEKTQTFYLQVQKKISRFLFGMILCAIAMMPYIFRFMIAPEYQQALLLTPILLISVYFDSMSSFLGGIFTANKETKIMGKTTIVAAVLNVVFCLVTLRLCGIYAAAFGTLIANVCIYLFRSVAIKKYIVFPRCIFWRVCSAVVCMITLYIFYFRYEDMSVFLVASTLLFFLISNMSLIKLTIARVKGRRND